MKVEIRKVGIKYTSQREMNRDREAEKKEAEMKAYAFRDYWRDRESWDAWEERGDSERDGFAEENALEYAEENYRSKEKEVERYKKSPMSEERIAHRTALLQRHLARA